MTTLRSTTPVSLAPTTQPQPGTVLLEVRQDNYVFKLSVGADHPWVCEQWRDALPGEDSAECMARVLAPSLAEGLRWIISGGVMELMYAADTVPGSPLYGTGIRQAVWGDPVTTRSIAREFGVCLRDLDAYAPERNLLDVFVNVP